MDPHEVDWLGASRAAAEALQDILVQRPTTAERVKETGGTGHGGDQTLIIDADAEEAVFLQLGRLHDDGARFTAVSEERGQVDFGEPGVIVIIDPIDGSLNAKRGISHHSMSIAVADGPTMADVFFAYVYDYGPHEEWVAVRGLGTQLDGVTLSTEAGERRTGEGRLEVLGIESADPRWIRAAADGLAASAHRVRALGTIAVTMCQVAAARFDGMLTLKPSRAVDSAAAQLIIREAGGHVEYVGAETPLAAPLDVEPRHPVIAARTTGALDELRGIAPS